MDGTLTCCLLIDTKIVYRRYASLYFIAGIDSTDNELITLEIVHRFVEQMDKYYGNVCELDIIFNFQKAYFILDELLLAGEMQESSKKNVLRCIGQQDSLEDMEVSILCRSHLVLCCGFVEVSADGCCVCSGRRRWCHWNWLDEWRCGSSLVYIPPPILWPALADRTSR